MKIKLNSIKKFLIGTLTLSTSIILTLNIETFANTYERNAELRNRNIEMLETINLANKSIVSSFNGSGNDYINSIVKTKDGGFVVAGNSSSINLEFENKGGSDAIIVKYNKNNNLEWIKNFGGSNYDKFNYVVEVKDGGYIGVGYSNSTDAGFESKGSNDAIIVKYSKNGEQEWFKNFGGSNYDYFYSVTETLDGGCITVGRSNSTNANFVNKGTYDAIMVKYNKDGNQEWIKTFGGSNEDEFTSIKSTSDKGFIVVGRYSSKNADVPNSGSIDSIIIKYNKNNEEEWKKTFNDTGWEHFYSVVETSDNGFVAVGGIQASQITGLNVKGSVDGLIVKYDKDGNQEWANTCGGSNLEFLMSVFESSDKGFITAGYSYSLDAEFNSGGGFDGIVVKYNKDGQKEWVKNFGGSGDEELYSIIEAPNNGFIAVGYSESSDVGFINTGGYDAIIFKYNEDCKENESTFLQLDNLKNGANLEEYNSVRDRINRINNEEIRRYLNEKLNKMPLNMGTLELETLTSILDLYIKSENSLYVTLSTNQIVFEEYSGVSDLILDNAIEVTINSSLPYELNAYMLDEIYNIDRSKKININELNIKDSLNIIDTDYKEFPDINTKLTLNNNCVAGNGIKHNIDLKLKGGNAYESDIYKTVIKFEAQQK